MNNNPVQNNTEPPAMSQLPDGIGLSLNQVTALLAAKNKATVTLDDPILMVVTLLNAFLTEEEKLLTKHNVALTSLLSNRTQEYIQAVQKTTASLGGCLSVSSLEGIKKIFASHGEKMERFQSIMIWLTVIAGASALVNVAVFVALALLKR